MVNYIESRYDGMNGSDYGCLEEMSASFVAIGCILPHVTIFYSAYSPRILYSPGIFSWVQSNHNHSVVVCLEATIVESSVSIGLPTASGSINCDGNWSFLESVSQGITGIAKGYLLIAINSDCRDCIDTTRVTGGLYKHVRVIAFKSDSSENFVTIKNVLVSSSICTSPTIVVLICTVQ